MRKCEYCGELFDDLQEGCASNKCAEMYDRMIEMERDFLRRMGE